MPRLPHNVEPSGFHRGEYVGHDSTTRPGVWRIKPRPGAVRGWYAMRTVGGHLTGDNFLYGATLAEVGDQLAKVSG